MTDQLFEIEHEKLCWGLRFENYHLQEEFAEFFRFKKHKLVLLGLNFCYTCIFFPTAFIPLHYCKSWSEWLYSLLNLIVVLVVVVLGWTTYFEENAVFRRYDRYFPNIKSALTAFYYAHSVLTAARPFFSDCSQIPSHVQRFVVGWSCSYDPEATLGFYQPFLVLFPILTFVSLGDVRIGVFLLETIIYHVATLIVYFYSSPERYYLLSIPIIIVACCMICVDIHYKHMRFFVLIKQLENVIAENKNIQEENRALELRNMIGNIAHDLKTPLTSFMSGTDIMNHTIQELNKVCRKEGSFEGTIITCSEESVRLDWLQERVNVLLEVLKNIENTNNFMSMTINRSIDYTKASKGLKLKPKYDTMDLLETICMPLDCMKNIQERIKIDLQDLPNDVCSHIITDKQWLQENELCLLSNAVKYSIEGSLVTMAMSLVKVKQEKPVHEDPSEKRAAEIPMESRKSFRSSPERKIVPINFDSLSAKVQSMLQQQKIKKYTPSTSLSAKDNIKEEVEEEQVYLRVEIADRGIGLSEQAMSNLFNPFQQAQKLTGGTGLGLYSLAKRMEAIQGRYGVYQRLDGEIGSVFWFEIPYRPDEEAARMLRRPTLVPPPEYNCSSPHIMSKGIASPSNQSIVTHIVGYVSPPVSPPPELQELQQQLQKLTILIVDDSPMIIKMISMMLRQKGHQVTSVENGALAVERLQKQWTETQTGYDVVLMDLQMPVMDGLEATKRWREHEHNQLLLQTTIGGGGAHHQVIIGMSANSDSDTMEDAFVAGVDDFIKKPFTMEIFLTTVNHVFDKVYPQLDN